jgi:hypothetical protein
MAARGPPKLSDRYTTAPSKPCDVPPRTREEEEEEEKETLDE